MENTESTEERTVLRKDQLEISLHNEKRLIKEGTIKDDNPLDLSEPFRELCSACRRGDLKACQEKITEGVNVNARDLYDYTPLILVSAVAATVPSTMRLHHSNNISNQHISWTGQPMRTL
jgi:ankyrin repeat protein